jgi:hypothetical protein
MLMRQQRAANRAKVCTDLFDELRTSLSAANDAVHASGGYVYAIPSHVDLARDAQKAGKQGRTPPHRFQQMLAGHVGA